jgi:hypothetical protein
LKKDSSAMLKHRNGKNRALYYSHSSFNSINGIKIINDLNSVNLIQDGI